MGLIAAASGWLAGLALKLVQESYRKIQQFTADAAHELRTPPSAIQATAESVIQLPQISAPEAKETLQVIIRQNQRLTYLVNDLLLLSRLDSQNPTVVTPCCLQDILSDSVEDTGIGIPSAEHHRIFDRFYRIDQNRSQQTGGVGLGLSIALAIAHSYGGDIQVESEIGKGSKFTVRPLIL